MFSPPELSITDKIIERYERKLASAKAEADAEADRRVDEAYIQSKADTSKTIVQAADMALWPMLVVSSLGMIFALFTRAPKTFALALAGLTVAVVLKGVVLRWGVVFVDLTALLLILGVIGSAVLAVAWLVPWVRVQLTAKYRRDIRQQGEKLAREPHEARAAGAVLSLLGDGSKIGRKAILHRVQANAVGLSERTLDE